jgi:pyruvate decarboxylase
VLNNDGYTIERLIHGETASYNDIQMWKYHKLLDVFNSKDGQSVIVNTTGQLDKLFNDPKFAEPNHIRLIEVVMPQMDAPAALVKQAEMSAAINTE